MENAKIKPVVQDLVDALDAVNLSAEVGDGYINIQRADGIHCEFYPGYEQHSEQFEVYNATYTIDGIETDLNFEMPFDQNEMVEAVQKILSYDSIPVKKHRKGSKWKSQLTNQFL